MATRTAEPSENLTNYEIYGTSTMALQKVLIDDAVDYLMQRWNLPNVEYSLEILTKAYHRGEIKDEHGLEMIGNAILPTYGPPKELEIEWLKEFELKYRDFYYREPTASAGQINVEPKNGLSKDRNLMLGRRYEYYGVDDLELSPKVDQTNVESASDQVQQKIETKTADGVGFVLGIPSWEDSDLVPVVLAQKYKLTAKRAEQIVTIIKAAKSMGLKLSNDWPRGTREILKKNVIAPGFQIDAFNKAWSAGKKVALFP